MKNHALSLSVLTLSLVGCATSVDPPSSTDENVASTSAALDNNGGWASTCRAQCFDNFERCARRCRRGIGFTRCVSPCGEQYTSCLEFCAIP